MTQITDENTTTPITEDTDLQDILDQAQQTQDTKSQEISLEELQSKIKELESKLADAEAITK